MTSSPVWMSVSWRKSIFSIIWSSSTKVITSRRTVQCEPKVSRCWPSRANGLCYCRARPHSPVQWVRVWVDIFIWKLIHFISIELYPQLHLLEPKLFSSKHQFGLRYCDAKLKTIYTKHRPVNIWKYTGATNLEELRILLETTVMIRRLKTAVLKDMPTKRREVVSFWNLLLTTWFLNCCLHYLDSSWSKGTWFSRVGYNRNDQGEFCQKQWK